MTEALVRVDSDVVWCVGFHGSPCQWFFALATISRGATDAELIHAY